MSTRVAFYLENGSIPDIDLSQPELGNPGCGGTEFLFAALPYYLEKLGAECEPILLANNIDRLPGNVARIKVADALEAVKQAKKSDCEVIVYRPRRHTEHELLKVIDAAEIPAIAWAHITPLGDHLRMMARTKYLKAVVCVEHEQCDLAQDTPIWDKLTFIVNGFDVEGFQLPDPPSKEPGLVVYLGALVPQKGFHFLAKAWPRIIERCPYAKLSVIGTGALYDNGAKLGPWGVAEQGYEERHLLPYLADTDGRPHQSVTFLGRLGAEKKRILYQAMVGVPNPSGQTENCPGSAIEFQACGTAVVSGGYYGLLDTVKHGQTGLLGRTEDDLVENICGLLENQGKAMELGKNGIRFVKTRYRLSSVVSDWMVLFESVKTGRKPKRIGFKKNLYRHHKYLIFINKIFQISLGRIMPWPSIIELKSKIARIMQNARTMKLRT